MSQVIHILFVSNHEKEVKISALVDAYEYEIDHVIADARSRLDAVEKQLQEARESSARLESEFNARIDQALAKNNEEWRLKVEVINTRFKGALSYLQKADRPICCDLNRREL